MNPEDYLIFCQAELRKIFERTRAGQPDDKLRYRAEGLLHAARLLGLASAEQLSELLEAEHQAVFGESVATRQARKAALTELKETDPDAYFDIPTVERKPR
jgi:hypothetical protein